MKLTNNKRKAWDIAVARAANPPKRQKKLNNIDRRAREVGGLAGQGFKPEFKNIDLTLNKSSAALGLWGPASLLCTIPQGNTATTRIGRKVTLKSLLIRWSTPYGTSTDNNQGWQGRIFVVYDREPLVTPLAAQILVDDNINGLMNLDVVDRYIIIADQYINSSDGNRTGYGKIYKKFNLEQLYTGSTLNSGQIYLFLNMNQNTTANALSFSCRIRYTDV